MKRTTNPFEVERIRAELAINQNLKSLQKTYANSYPEIKDLNTPKLWDSLNVPKEKIKTNNPMENTRLKYVVGLIRGSALSVFHIGFGSASLEKIYFKRKASSIAQWHGIDISPASVKKAKKEFPQGNFKRGNISKLNYPDNAFDYVVSLEVLEHIPPSKILGCLKEIYRVTKPGKYFIASVPLNEGLEEMVSRGDNPNAHVRTYTPELIKAELELVGFAIISEKKLYAFNNLYKFKSFIARHLLKRRFHYNNIILKAQKPN